jgi:tRNA 2-thiouridine synthesizing protein E
MEHDMISFLILFVVIFGAIMGALIGLLAAKPQKSVWSNFLRGAFTGIPASIISIIIAFFTALSIVEHSSELMSFIDSRRSEKKVRSKPDPIDIEKTTENYKVNRKPRSMIIDNKEDSILIQKEVAAVVKKANSLSGKNMTEFDTDENGYLKNPDDWSAQWVYFIMQQEGIEKLTEEHEHVIVVLRIYYMRNGIAPMIRVISKVTDFKMKHIYELFPSGPGKGACRMAGLPKPTGVL